MPLRFQKFIARADLQAHPEWLYVFGDNDQRRGLGGQALEMRGEPNALGVRTKHKPRRDDASYWRDATFEENCRKIDEDLGPVFTALREGRTVVIPEDGLGTGLARLSELAPRTFEYLNGQLASVAREGGSKP